MAVPACERYSDALSRIKDLLLSDKAAANLCRYLSSYGGAQFDRLSDRLAADAFTPADFRAVRELGVNVCIRPASGSSEQAGSRYSNYYARSPQISISGKFRPIGSIPNSDPTAQLGDCGRLSLTCKTARGSPVSTSQRASCCTANARDLSLSMTGAALVKLST